MRRLITAVAIVLMAGSAMAAEKRSIIEIDVDALTTDTQVSVAGASNDHVAIVWWIPVEFWQSVLARDPTVSDAGRNAALEVLSGISLVAVVQADITPLGAFIFYPKEEVEKTMSIMFSDARGERQRLRPMQTIDPSLQLVLDMLKPILGNAMGNLGNNMHFYVLDDRSQSSSRLLDPYREGRISIQLTGRNGSPLNGQIEMPLNSLFVPRRCPNGKEAHISWKYCPWSGKPLKE